MRPPHHLRAARSGRGAWAGPDALALTGRLRCGDCRRPPVRVSLLDGVEQARTVRSIRETVILKALPAAARIADPAWSRSFFTGRRDLRVRAADLFK